MKFIHVIWHVLALWIIYPGPAHLHRDRLKGLKIVSIVYPTAKRLYARHQADSSSQAVEHAVGLDEPGYPDTLSLEFAAFGREFRLDLSKSEHLFPESGILRMTSDGKQETRFIDGFYQGHVYAQKEQMKAVGWARVHIEHIQASPSLDPRVHMDGTMTLDDTGALYNLQQVTAHASGWHPHRHVNVARGVDLFSDSKMCYMQQPNDSIVSLRGSASSDNSTDSEHESQRHDEAQEQGKDEIDSTLELVKVESVQLSCGHDLLQFNVRANGAPATHAKSISAHHAKLPSSRYLGHPLLAADELARSDGLEWTDTMTVANISSRLPLVDQAPPPPPRTRRRQVASNSSGISTNPLLDIVPLEGASCPTTLKVLYMGVAADCAYSAAYENNVAAIESSILKMWNVISGIYQYSFNIQLGIVNLHIMKNCSTEADIAADNLGWNRPCQKDYNISDKLNDFSRWRGTTQSTDAGLWHLVSAKDE